MIDKNLLYLSYGSQTEYRRAIFSIYSFYAWNTKVENVKIIVFTDNPEYFKSYLPNLDIEYILLDSLLEEKLLDNSSYIHLKKVGVVDMGFKLFPNRHQLFIDTDTFFFTNADALLNGFEKDKSFMHKREYTLEEGLELFSSFNQGEFPEVFINYTDGRDFVINNSIENFTKKDYSWNSGVLALHKDFKIYMDDIRKLTIQFYDNSKWFISEQLAFSFVLQKKTEVRASDMFIYHYWGKRQKQFTDLILSDLFANKSVAELKDQNFIKRFIKNLRNNIEIDLSLEQIEIALAKKDWFYAFKKSCQFVLKNPANLKLYKTLFN